MCWRSAISLLVAQLPTNVPFDAWLDYLFGAPVGPSGFRESEEWWEEQAAPDRAVEYLTRLFEARRRR